jgi:hypothetical protein
MSGGKAESKSNENLYHKALLGVQQPGASETLLSRTAATPINFSQQSGRDIRTLEGMAPFLNMAEIGEARSREMRKGTGALQMGGPQNEGYLTNLRQLYASDQARQGSRIIEEGYGKLYENAMNQLANSAQMENQRKGTALNATSQIYATQRGKPSMWGSIIQGAAAVGSAAAMTSDIRLKFNVQTVPYGLEEVLELRPVKYIMDGSEQVGFIAQEVDKIMPELVVDIRDGMKGLMYGNMAAVLAKAIQELNEKVEKTKRSKPKGRIRKLLSSYLAWLSRIV